MNANSLQQNTLSAQTSLCSKLYDSLTDIPLYKLINVFCDNNLLELIISGSHSQIELQSAWMKIYEEFLDGMKDASGLYKVRLLSKISKLEFIYDSIQLCIKRLSLAPSKDAIDFISIHIRVNGKFNPEDQKNYFNDLQSVRNGAQMIFGELEERRREYEMIEGSNENGEKIKVTKKHFDSMLVQLSAHFKFHVDKKQITGGEFVEMYTSMREHCEELAKQSKR